MAEDTSKVEKSDLALREEAILKYWQEHDIFKKTLEKEAPKGEFTFYDGPPFANGLPHYGHMLASFLKDVLPRYKTMQGYHVPRRWGWDCHGLPVENLVEKELDLKTKKDIELYGIKEFNERARTSIMSFAHEWQWIIPRVGRFVDMQSDYKTMDATYTESIWWSFKTLFDKGLVYEGYKPMHICPRCETTLANFEVNQGYKDITDISAYVRFQLTDAAVQTFLQVSARNATHSVAGGLGNGNVHLLAWTTTPWTLPGNVALAVNPEVTYVVAEKEGAYYVLAKELTEKVLKENYSIVTEVAGKDLVGLSYLPVFDYFANDEGLKNKERGWKVYGADFVTTESGTGIVHIAPAFGEDDMNLGQKEGLPFIQHVSMDGRFTSEVKDFAGEQVKPKDDHQKADIEIIKYLAGKGTLFAKEKIVHSYPHCWRCDTPLLNYAASSWFVKVTDIKDHIIAANQAVTWVPEHIKDGRFGRWLEGARDWAISRSRFWGAPIPVWRCDECKEIRTIGSVADLKAAAVTSGNTYTVMRHGEGEHNVRNIISCQVDNPHHLTEAGKVKVQESACLLKDTGIDLIIASDFVRTRETAALVQEALGLSVDQIIFDERLREVNFGSFEGKGVEEYHAFMSEHGEDMTKSIGGGESYDDVRRRAAAFLYNIDSKYQSKKILIITHESVVWLLDAACEGVGTAGINRHYSKEDYILPGESKTLDFKPLPHNDNFELDLHRPYIDAVKLKCRCGGVMERVSDVFDCWYESGSMPFAQAHYPFNKNSSFDPSNGKGFPADFIAEGLDQTRGWFYSLIVLSTALFGVSPYKNVIVNGLVLAEDGQKMSKKLKNYPDPIDIINKYGVDALRFYMLSSPVVYGEDLKFSEKGVGELQRKVIMRLWNTYAFYEMYAGSDAVSDNVSDNILDRWIISRLNQTIAQVEKSLDKYEIDRATRPIDDFIDDLSNWYLRRSRDRFKSEDAADRAAAIATTKQVLMTIAKVMAPFTPFVAEELYQKLGGKLESIHLESWPTVGEIDESLVAQMSQVRDLISLALEARAAAGVKVRQPLASLYIKDSVPEIYYDLIKDEVNVKTVTQDDKLETEVKLDTTITPELKEEGEMRELIRQVQDLRKQQGFNPSDVIVLTVGKEAELVRKFEVEIKKAVSAGEVVYQDGAGELSISR